MLGKATAPPLLFRPELPGEIVQRQSLDFLLTLAISGVLFAKIRHLEVLFFHIFFKDDLQCNCAPLSLLNLLVFSNYLLSKLDFGW